LIFVVGLVFAPTAEAKQGKAVVVIGPSRQAMVEPFAPIGGTLDQFGLTATLPPPNAPYVLVYPLMEQGVPMRPGRWYPAEQLLCSGWRTGVEAGCLHAPSLRGLLGTGIATGLFHQRPTLLSRLTRQRTSLGADGNEATAIEMSLNQSGRPASQPAGCVPFTARWTGPQAASKPGSFCVARTGGIFVGGRVYPLPSGAARFVVGG
jgi:hypothetical protein